MQPKSGQNTNLTKQKINATALELFSIEGYYHVSIRQLASKCGIALGLMYNYYRSKEDLLSALFSEGIEKIKEECAVFFQQEDVDFAIRGVMGVLQKQEQYWRLYHSVRMQQSLAGLLKEKIEEINGFFTEQFRMMLKSKGEKKARTGAKIIYTTLDGVFAQWAMDNTFPVEKVLERLAGRY